MDKLTDEQLSELERLERAATPEGWEFYNRNSDGYIDDDYAIGFDVVGPHPSGRGRFSHAADAQLIAALRNAAPALLAEVRELRAKLERMEDEPLLPKQE